MPVFFLAEVEVLDHDKYHEYIDRASQIIQRYGGEYVFRSEHIVPVSGNWTPQRLVLIRFNSKTDIHRCFGSKEYQKIKNLREQSTKSRAVIIDEDGDAIGIGGSREATPYPDMCNKYTSEYMFAFGIVSAF